jgi:hypothetical protein
MPLGFMNFLKNVGSGLAGGIGKIAGLVGKIAPVVGGIAGMIPTPATQGIAGVANLAGGVANAVNSGGGVQGVAQSLQGTPAGGIANTVSNVVGQAQQIMPQGMAQPIM